MVAALHSWAGKRYADPAGGDVYVAVVYSNVEAPNQGKKFGGAAANDEFEYAMTNGSLAMTPTATGLADAAVVAAQVALTGVIRTAGTETFKLPDPNQKMNRLSPIRGASTERPEPKAATPALVETQLARPR